ncbi:hypothetical protein ACQPZX_26885 [Actinoplanes sp. CA-142083]|uniref:hypothetical protein n=1 Tax=Actinoplanes sp. CA-142083 TaxID=3239903 RepID=UPI003D8C0965
MIYIVGPAVAALLMAIFVVVMRRRRARLPETFVVSPAVPDAGESEAERRERLLWAAFRSGDIPACWYRQQMAAIAADTADQGPRV